MPGMTWDGDANCKLLLSILKTQDVKVDFEAVSKELSTDTITCTPRAVQEQLKKLKKQAAGTLGSPMKASDGDTPGPKPKATPNSKKRAAGDTDTGTLSKKPKKAATGKTKGVKTEIPEEDEAEMNP